MRREDTAGYVRWTLSALLFNQSQPFQDLLTLTGKADESELDSHIQEELLSRKMEL